MGISIVRVPSGADEFTELVQLHIFVEDSDWFGTFDHIQVYRSRGLSTGPYEPLTAYGWKPARIPADGGDEPTTWGPGPVVDIVGDTLSLRINEADDYDIVFTDPGPGTLTYADAISQIETATQARLRGWIDDDGALVLETLQPGTGAALRIVGGDAAPKLGLPTTEPNSLAYGLDSNIALMKGKERYVFNDLKGDSAYFYRTRFHNRSQNTASAFTQPSHGDQPLGVSAENIVCGRIQLVGLDGRPLRNMLVRVFNRFKQQLVEDKLLAGPAVDGLTNEHGTLELNLVRGVEVTVAIDGTDIVREITVPTDPDVGVFNLLDPTLGPDDYWKVRAPNVEYAQRRSLNP